VDPIPPGGFSPGKIIKHLQEMRNQKMSFHPLLTSLFLIGLMSHGLVQGKDDPAGTVRFGNGVRELHYGIPFLYLKGTDYEAGLQYGHLLQKELNSLHAEFESFKRGLMDREIRRLPRIQRWFAGLFGGMVFRHRVNAYADRLPGDVKAQVRGAAKGSGLPADFFREILVFTDLYAKWCEGIVIIKGNRVVHAHNLDQPYPVSLLSKYSTVVQFDIEGKQKYTDIGFAGVLIPTTAFNESGMSISENGNNSARGFDRGNCSLYASKRLFITDARSLADADSIARTLLFPVGFIFTIGSAFEKKAAVYDFIGPDKDATPVNGYRFVANRTVSDRLGKKTRTLYSVGLHEAAREFKFSQLIDTTRTDLVDEVIGILGNTDFYHYTDSVSTYIESLHNYQTDQSVVFDLADSAVYFAVHPHFAAWSRWIKFNPVTREVGVYREADERLASPFIGRWNRILTEYEACDWRDSSNVRSVLNAIVASGIRNYFTLQFLSRTCLNGYGSAEQAMGYAGVLIEKYPDILTGYLLKGRVLETQRRFDEAIVEYLRALDCGIQWEQGVAEVDERLALSYDSVGQKESAAAYAEKALAIHDPYWTPEYMKGRLAVLERIKTIK
jgi:hypothetical protein